jgi:hypothetical protein
MIISVIRQLRAVTAGAKLDGACNVPDVERQMEVSLLSIVMRINAIWLIKNK